MADKRKLNAEIDRCLKKVSEGGEVFDDIWEKVQQSNNANQKEKLELDLKKEIKKLQRLRDQIKTWSVSGEVKDKEPLFEARKNIEAQMEKFKVIERETKTKAYSKEGLTTALKVDPHERQKDEIRAWVSTAITSLYQQLEKSESEAESFRGKKKMDKEDTSSLECCDKMMKRLKFHLGKLESILRKVDNDAVEFNQISSLQDTVEYLVGTPDDMEVADIYDELALDDVTTNSSSPMENDLDQTYASALNNHVPTTNQSYNPTTIHHTPTNHTITIHSSLTNHNSFNNSTINQTSAPLNHHFKSRDEDKRKLKSFDDLASTVKYPSSPKTPSSSIHSSPPTNATTIPHPTTITHPSTTPHPTTTTHPTSPFSSFNRITHTPIRTNSLLSQSNDRTNNQPIKSTLSSLALGYAQVVNSQYSSTNHNGKSNGAMDKVIPSSTNGIISHSLLTLANTSNNATPEQDNKSASSFPTSGAARALFPTSKTTMESYMSNNNNTTTTTMPLLHTSYNIQQKLSQFTPTTQQLYQQKQQFSQHQQQELLNSQLLQQQQQKLQLFLQTSNHQQLPQQPNHHHQQQSLLKQPQQQPQQQQQWSDDNNKLHKYLPNGLPNGFNNNLNNKEGYLMQTSASEMLSKHNNNLNNNNNNLNINNIINNNNINNNNNSATSTSTVTEGNEHMDGHDYDPAKVVQTNHTLKDVSPTLLQQQLQQQYPLNTNPTSNYPPRSMRIEGILGLTPLGPLPLRTDHVSKSAMLESASLHLPLTCDSERIRVYLPSNPCTMPVHYPRGLNPSLNLPDFFNRLDPETLFFAFYYLEGTKAQFLAAKALKQKSWRFHTKYLLWFQRHEKPKTINEEYEQGTYIYFDYEHWAQRKKESFKFEYRHLEDQDLN